MGDEEEGNRLQEPLLGFCTLFFNEVNVGFGFLLKVFLGRGRWLGIIVGLSCLQFRSKL